VSDRETMATESAGNGQKKFSQSVRIREVEGSNPFGSTRVENHRQIGGDFSFDHNKTTDGKIF